MLFSPRVPPKPLIALCQRLSTALEAGIDVRTAWAREADRAQGPLRDRLSDISQAVNQGQSVADALSATADFFPTLFLEMVALGEQTGQLDTVLAQLADHYQNQLNMRRIFLAAILWPMLQLVIAVIAVGFLIWIMGFIREMTGSKTLDMLGLGLIGNRGLAIYIALVALVGGSVWIVIRAINRGLVWTRPIQRFVLGLPGIGRPLQTLALARLAWSMHVTMNVGMEVRRALRLSLQSTQNSRFTDQIPVIEAEISAGHSIHEAFCHAGGYPHDFLDSLAVGEDSGKIVESMGLLAKQYQDQARMALSILTLFAGWAVWAAVAALLIMLILRLFSFYIGAINEATKF